MKNYEKIALCALISFGGLILLAFILSLHIVILAGLAMVMCNGILPLFDVNYPITFLQGCGVGMGVLIVRSLFGSVLYVNK